MKLETSDYINKISIGTASFGMRYGVTNKEKASSFEVQKILKIAKKYKINYFDTAPLYGSSEKLLGKFSFKNSQITTKTKQIKKSYIGKQDIYKISNCFNNSLKYLGRNKVHSLLIHETNNLLNTGGDRLFEWMEEIKSKGKIKKIGISIYNERELDLILSKYSIDLVQLPFNIFDQRFLKSGHINYLSKKNIEIHARSIFLQGLLVSKISSIPKNLKKYEKKIKDLHDFAYKKNLSIIELLLSFVMKSTKIDKYVIGVNSEYHLKNILFSLKRMKNLNSLSKFYETDEKLIIPKNWQ